MSGTLKKKTSISVLCAVLVALSVSAQAQQAKKVGQVGLLVVPSRSAFLEPIEAFRQGLRDLGYEENKNIMIAYRYAEGRADQLPELASELVRLKVDVIVVAGGHRAITAAKNATSTIPIVFTGSTNPVESGFVASLAHPGGNVTGLTLGGFELYGKRLELLKETVPKISRVAVFWDVANPAIPEMSNETRAAAQVLGLHVESFGVRSLSDFEGAFQAAVEKHADALVVSADVLFTANRKRIVELVAKKRLPAIYGWREYVEDGGLMSYATKLSDLYHHVAIYVDKILRGAKPADLPVEQPTKLELVINLKTAKQLGLTIPQSMLYRADKVIK